jgi:hypothetical protein
MTAQIMQNKGHHLNIVDDEEEQKKGSPDPNPPSTSTSLNT